MSSEGSRMCSTPTDGSYRVETHRARSWVSWRWCCTVKRFRVGRGLKLVEVMIEVMMDKEDVTTESKAALGLAGKQLAPLAD